MFNIFSKEKVSQNNFGNIDKLKEISEESNENIENIIKNDEEWVWVEGYKGTDENMRCKDFQYELNKVFVYDGDVEIYNSGFHFCDKLEDTFSYYKPNGKNRFFKVRSLINKNLYKYINTYGNRYYTYYVKVAKQIEFLEEINDFSSKDYVKKNFKWIETDDEISKVLNDDNFNNEVFCKNKFKRRMKELGFAESYISIKAEELDNKSSSVGMNVHHIFFNKAKAYTDEGMSKDMIIYLLEIKQ